MAGDNAHASAIGGAAGVDRPEAYRAMSHENSLSDRNLKSASPKRSSSY
jgi:hypothetical protein